MKTFTNHALTLKDEQLLKNAIEIITDETILHNNTKSTFTIYGNIKVLIKTDHAEIEIDSESLVQLDDVNKLLNFLLVETHKLKGIWHLRDRGVYFSGLSFQDQKHIRRLSEYPFTGESVEAIYEKLVYDSMTPKEFKEEFEVSAKFITALRKANRKMIVSRVIDEVMSEKNRMPNPNKKIIVSNVKDKVASQKSKSSRTQTKSIVDNGKSIKGKIVKYNEEECEGNILGDDGIKYYFETSNTDKPFEIKKGLFVQFEPIKNERNKLEAINIFIDNTTQKNNNQRKTKKTITINDETILVSSILSYSIDIERPTHKDYMDFIDVFDLYDDDYDAYDAYNECYDEYGDEWSDDYDKHDYLDCLDSSISSNYIYWDGGSIDSFDKDKYLYDLKNSYTMEADYSIKIKFKNGKSRYFGIGSFTVPYKIFWKTCLFTPNIFDEYRYAYDSIYGKQKYEFRIPELVFSEEYYKDNEIYKEAMKIIEELDQLIQNI